MGLEIWFPGLTIPGVTIPKGLLIDTQLLAWKITIPWVDIVLWGDVELWKGFKLLDLNDLLNPIIDFVNAIPRAVWGLLESTLNAWVKDWYEETEK